mgnify:CR=1 FL=1
MSEEDSLWEDKEKAQSIFKEKRKLENLLNNFNKLEAEYEDLVNFNELFKSENDDGLKQELTDLLTNTVKLSTVLKINTLLSGEADGNDCDFLSNGFKHRTTGSGTNGSGYSYIYMAFAEHPFVGDGTSPVTAR